MWYDQSFCEDGTSVPVTVLQIDSNRVTQIKSIETDGYRSVQVTVGEKKSSRVNKPLAGHYAAANVTAGRGLWEFRLDDGEGENLSTGSELLIDIFQKVKLSMFKEKVLVKDLLVVLSGITFICKMRRMVTPVLIGFWVL